MTGDDLRDRTRKFSMEIVDLCDALPSLPTVLLVRNQLFRAGTGVGANYRSACRSRSRKEFISRVAIALEEADECEFWLDVLEHRRTGNAAAVKRLRQEASELRAILAASRRTAIRNLRKAQEMDAV